MEIEKLISQLFSQPTVELYEKFLAILKDHKVENSYSISKNLQRFINLFQRDIDVSISNENPVLYVLFISD